MPDGAGAIPCLALLPSEAALVDQTSGMQAILEQESRIAGFKGEVAKSQELHLASLSRDTERLTNSLEKMRAEIRYVACGVVLASSHAP